MPTFTSVRIDDRFDCAIEKAWPLFADFEGMPKVVAGCYDVTATGSGEGMIRHVPVDQRFTDERLELMDHEARRVIYSVVNWHETVMFRHYTAQMHLTPAGPDACNFMWRSHFAVLDGVDPESVRQTLLGAYRNAIAGFKAALAKR